MKKVLFLCTHNSARSQMAEGWLNHLCSNNYIACSAGTEPSAVNPYVIQVMKDAGIDLSTHTAKSVNDFVSQDFDYIVTVCDHAKEACPYFPGGKTYLHQSFQDPSGFTGTEAEILAHVTTVSEEIRQWIIKTFK